MNNITCFLYSENAIKCLVTIILYIFQSSFLQLFMTCGESIFRIELTSVTIVDGVILIIYCYSYGLFFGRTWKKN